jgi:hypothetical protein
MIFGYLEDAEHFLIAAEKSGSDPALLAIAYLLFAIVRLMNKEEK